MHESYRIFANGTGGKQFATRIALYCCANACRSADVVPATPNGDVRLGAPGVDPEIAAGHPGTAVAVVTGAGCANSGFGGAVAAGRPELPTDVEVAAVD